MKLHSIIGNGCLVASIASLAVAYGFSTYWPVLLTLPVMLLFWILAERRLAPWRSSTLLCIYLGLAVAAVLLKLPPLPVEFGCVAALIWWDLEDFRLAQARQIPAKATGLLQKYRLQSLALTGGVSLLLAGIGFWLRIQLPFGVIALLILLITACLVYAAGILKNLPLRPE